MARPKKPPNEKLRVVPFRLSDYDLAAIDAAAKAAGITRAEWGRSVMLAEAKTSECPCHVSAKKNFRKLFLTTEQYRTQEFISRPPVIPNNSALHEPF